MRQEIGETADAICEDDARVIDGIIEKNKGLREPYYILIAMKPGKLVDPSGRRILKRYFKVHKTRPPSMVGSMIVEINNVTGTITWEVNPPDVPFNYQAVGGEASGTMEMPTSIPRAYIYN